MLSVGEEIVLLIQNSNFKGWIVPFIFVFICAGYARLGVGGGLTRIFHRLRPRVIVIAADAVCAFSLRSGTGPVHMQPLAHHINIVQS
jgi:hypothetical protein